MRLKGFLGTAVMFAMLFNIATSVIVFASGGDIPVAPALDSENMIVYDDFEQGTTINGALSGSSSSHEDSGVAIVDGRIWVSKQSPETKTISCNYYFNKDKVTGYAGDRLTLEFKLEREGTGPFYVNSNRTSSSVVANIQITGSQIKARDGVTMKTVKSDYTSSSSTFIIQHNFTKETYSLWVDGELLASDFGFRYADTVIISNIYAYVNKDEGGSTYYSTFYIDDIKLYHAEPTNSQAVDANIEAIEDAGAETLITEKEGDSALGFSYDAEYDCDVVFSSEKGFVNEDGSINYPRFAEKDVVTVKISKGSYEKDIVFPANIAGVFYIGEIEFENESPVSGENYSFIEAYSKTEETTDIVVIMAAYECGVLKDVNIETNTIIPKSENPAENQIFGLVEVSEVTENTTVKAFIFDNLDNIRPLK